MTPEAAVRELTSRHASIMTELGEAFAERRVDALRTLVERHRMSIHLSAYWLLAETSAFPTLRRRFADQTKRVQDRLRTLRALEIRARSMRDETRRLVRSWLAIVRELVDAAAHETTNAGRELLVRAYQRADQLARKRTTNSVPAEVD